MKYVMWSLFQVFPEEGTHMWRVLNSSFMFFFFLWLTQVSSHVLNVGDLQNVIYSIWDHAFYNNHIQMKTDYNTRGIHCFNLMRAVVKIDSMVIFILIATCYKKLWSTCNVNWGSSGNGDKSSSIKLPVLSVELPE